MLTPRPVQVAIGLAQSIKRMWATGFVHASTARESQLNLISLGKRRTSSLLPCTMHHAVLRSFLLEYVPVVHLRRARCEGSRCTLDSKHKTRILECEHVTAQKLRV